MKLDFKVIRYHLKSFFGNFDRFVKVQNQQFTRWPTSLSFHDFAGIANINRVDFIHGEEKIIHKEYRDCPAMTPTQSFGKWFVNTFEFFADGSMYLREKSSISD